MARKGVVGGAAALMGVVAALTLRSEIVLDAPGHVYVEKDTPMVCGGEAGAAFAVVDWRGRPVTGPFAFDDAGKARLPPLLTGYYAITGRHPSERLATLAVVPALESRTFDHSSFCGVDSAQSWTARKGRFICPWNGGDTFRTVSDLIELAGIPHVRERLKWRDVNAKPGSFDWMQYMYNADLLHARHILVSGMFHDTPDWVDGRKRRLPADLAAVRDFCHRVATAFGDRMGDWEFWNEPDIHAASPAWDYAAALKAAWFGFKAARPEMPVAPAGMAEGAGGFFMRALFENDVAKFADVFNYHTYSPLSAYRKQFADLYAFLDEYGVGDRAVWLTEVGGNVEGPAADKGRMGCKAHSPEQEMVMAEFCAKSLVLLRMHGIARAYWFVFCPYAEQGGRKDWGLMRWDGTVKPAYAAASTHTRELVSAKIVGEINVGKDAKAYLFRQPDGTQTVAFWTVSPVDVSSEVLTASPDYARTIRLVAGRASSSAAEETSYRLADMCGTTSRISATNGVLVLPATRFPSYVSGLRGLKADIPARPAGRIRPYVSAPDEDLSVVIRAELADDDFSLTLNKTRAELKADSGRMRIFVWNFGETAKTGTVEVAGGRLSGLPGTPFTLGPYGSGPAAFDCVYAPDGDSFDSNLVLFGRFNGRRGSRLSIPIWMEKRFLATCERVPLAWTNLASWVRNDSAQRYRCSWDEAEHAVRFDFEWTGANNKWFYPRYRLVPGESLCGGKRLVFEVKSAQDKVENDFSHAHVYLGGGHLNYPAPVGSWETRHVDLPAGTGDEIRDFRLGANPRGRKVTFWVRNVTVLNGKRGTDDKAP